MTPYAVLHLHPVAEDDDIRRRFHEVIQPHHPDKNNGVQGSEWTRLTEAYTTIKTSLARAIWLHRQKSLVGLCLACDGYGMVGRQAKPRVCEACAGAGRKPRRSTIK